MIPFWNTFRLHIPTFQLPRLSVLITIIQLNLSPYVAYLPASMINVTQFPAQLGSLSSETEGAWSGNCHHLWLTHCWSNNTHYQSPLPACGTCVRAQSHGRVQLFVTPWIVAHQAHLSLGFSRQTYWSGLPFPTPGDLLDPGIELPSPAFSASQADSLLLSHQGTIET